MTTSCAAARGGEPEIAASAAAAATITRTAGNGRNDPPEPRPAGIPAGRFHDHDTAPGLTARAPITGTGGRSK